MTYTDIRQSLERFSGSGVITASQLGRFLGDSNPSRVRRKYLNGLEAFRGKLYLTTDVAKRLKETCEYRGEDDD